MTVQEKLDESAKSCGYDFAKKQGTYRGCDVWSFCTEEPKCLGYPLFALVKGKKAQVIGYGHKYHQEIWDYVSRMAETRKQKKLNKLAKEWDHDFATKLGEYKGSELWTFDTNEFSASGFPLFVLVDDSLAEVITPGSKEYDAIFKFSGTLPDDDEDTGTD